MATKDFTIRAAGAGDSAALAELAALDSAPTPRGPVLLAEVDGLLWAALELATGTVVADPFRPSGELAELLRFHAERRERPRRGRPALARLLPRAA